MGEGRREVEGKRGGGGEVKVKGERKRKRGEEEVEGGRRRGGGNEEMREACEGERCVLFYWHNGTCFAA